MILNRLLDFHIVTSILIFSSADQVQFNLLSKGFKFLSSNPNGLLVNISYSTSRILCMKECLNNILCRTIHFDPSIQQCTLFSSWLFEGSTSSSPSATSEVVYIKQEPVLYTLYHAPCVPSNDPINRYMQCVNNMWSCPNGYFYNGMMCEHQRSFNQSCQSDEWCDSSASLSCSNWSSRCRCNSLMSWDGSQCNSICSGGSVGISFEDLSVPMIVPNGYAGFRWSNMHTCNFNDLQRTCNRNMGPMNFSRINGTFHFRQIVIYPYINDVNVTFIGQYMGTVVYNLTKTYNSTYVWIEYFSWNNVDTIIVQSSPEPRTPIINLDDLCYI